MSSDLEGNEFCDMCGILLPSTNGIAAIFGKKPTNILGKKYCLKCATIKINKARSGKWKEEKQLEELLEEQIK